MQSRLRGARRNIPALALCVQLIPAVAAQSAPPLLVMLQGGNLVGIEASVLREGATITHRLPIINAVGARMSAQQLETVLETTEGIDRVIDDLAWEPEPDVPDSIDCSLASGIELSWSSDTASWFLYNKSDTEIEIVDLSIEWPNHLGNLQRADFRNNELALLPGEGSISASGKLTAEAPLLLPANSVHAITLAFSRTPANPFITQNDMRLRASTKENCHTNLARSYSHPRLDTYFPTVSGASALHAHDITGQGIGVAILDSGLWEDNPELSLNTRGKPRITARFDAITNTMTAEVHDESGHGTHLASVLARSGAVQRDNSMQVSYRGIAPDADIIVVKAFGGSGEAGFLDIVRGIQWVVQHHERLNIRILNLSFAARPRWPYWQDPVNQALMQAWKAGIFVTAAAGNEGPEPATVGSPGNLPYILTVGAITDRWTETDRNDDYVPDFSSHGPTPMGHIKPDVVALGGHMTGIVPPGSALHQEFPEYWLSSDEFVMTGTSQATALVSGLAALILQLEPELTNDELKCKLITSAEPAIELDGRLAYSPFVQGEGRVSLKRALTLGDKECRQSDLNLDKDIAGLDHYQGPAIFSDSASPGLPGLEQIVADAPLSEGSSSTLRWGAADHLSRLTEKPTKAAIDWETVFIEEQKRVKAIAAQQD